MHSAFCLIADFYKTVNVTGNHQKFNYAAFKLNEDQMIRYAYCK